MTFIDWSVGEPWAVVDSSVTGSVCFFRSSGFGITLWKISAAAPEGGAAYLRERAGVDVVPVLATCHRIGKSGMRPES